MGFDILSFALGQKAAKASGGGSVSKEEILAEYTAEFVFNTSLQVFLKGEIGWFPLETGEKYLVQWDGKEYTVTAFSYNFNGNDAIILGNEKYIKGESSEIVEPFAIYRVISNDYCVLASMTDTTAKSHTVAIYKIVSSGGSSGEYSIQEGDFDATSQEMTVSHGGNKIPDIIIVSTNDVPAAKTLFLAYGFSQAMIDRLGNGYFSRVKFLEATGGSMSMTANVGIDKVSSSDRYSVYGGIRNVTDKTFTIGCTSVRGYLDTNTSYSYMAIFGLT